MRPLAPSAQAPTRSSGPGWWVILTHWESLCCDMHHLYGWDEEAPRVWRRSWPWLRRRIMGCVARPDTLTGRLLAQD